MTITQKVEYILKKDEKSRSSDKRLLYIFMQKSGMDLTEEQRRILYEMPSLETIRRIRQKFQQEGQYPAAEEVDNQRFEKFKQVREGIPHATPAETERLL